MTSKYTIGNLYPWVYTLDVSQTKNKAFLDWNREFGIHLIFKTQIRDLNPSYPHDGHDWVPSRDLNFYKQNLRPKTPQILAKRSLPRLYIRIWWPDATSLPANPSAALLQHGVSWSVARSKLRKECSGGAIKMWIHQVFATYEYNLNINLSHHVQGYNGKPSWNPNFYTTGFIKPKLLLKIPC